MHAPPAPGASKTSFSNVRCRGIQCPTMPRPWPLCMPVPADDAASEGSTAGPLARGAVAEDLRTWPGGGAVPAAPLYAPWSESRAKPAGFRKGGMRLGMARGTIQQEPASVISFLSGALYTSFD